MKNIAVIVAHPDDEVLGCGGTIAKHVKNGDIVHVLICGEGITSRTNDNGNGMSQLQELIECSKEANKILGVSGLKHLLLPDNRLDTLGLLSIIQKIEHFLEEVESEVIYTHYGGDLNIDHRIVNQAVITATRPIPGTRINTLLFFETPSSTEWQDPNVLRPFAPNWFVDIADTLNTKIEALKKYYLEMRSWPHARSLEAVEHLARWRGASSGFTAAEAFQLGKRRV